MVTSRSPLASASMLTKSRAAIVGSLSSSYPAGIDFSNRPANSARAPREARTWSSQSSAILVVVMVLPATLAAASPAPRHYSVAFGR